MGKSFFSYEKLKEIKIVDSHDVALAGFVLILVSIIIFPVPSFILDVGIALSVSVSVLMVLVAIFIEKPLEFNSFPSMLLLSTLLRLALEVATTRLILSHGADSNLAAGHIVSAFGSFLMDNNIAIGVVIFILLISVNFMVVTKGAGRISEVAARFSLDAMPGKQMALDTELSSGSISEVVARKRRRELEEESAFYGAMDGASKFVKGDVVASIIISIVNIVGGIAVGVFGNGMLFPDAISSFTKLTIGDGLVSQIPALMVSISSGIVVTKSGVNGRLANVMADQMAKKPKPLALVAISCAALGLMPGIPIVPFWGIAGITGYLAYRNLGKVVAVDYVDDAVVPVSTGSIHNAPAESLTHIEPLKVDLGFNLLSIALGDDNRLTEQIRTVRRTISDELGVVIPPVRVQDGAGIGGNTYEIKVRNIPCGIGELRASRLLVMDPAGGVPRIDGEAGKEPVFGLPAIWIEQTLREDALMAGYTVVDAASIISTHLSEIIRDNICELLSYSATQHILDNAPDETRRLIADMVPSVVTVGMLQKILRGLLSERVSIRDIGNILEGINEAHGMGMKSVTLILAHTRKCLSRQIGHALAGPANILPVITIGPDWERVFYENLSGIGEERQLNMAPSRVTEFLASFKRAFEEISGTATPPTIVVGNAIRLAVRSIVMRVNPSIAVLSYEEISPKLKIKTIGSLASPV